MQPFTQRRLKNQQSSKETPDLPQAKSFCFYYYTILHLLGWETSVLNQSGWDSKALREIWNPRYYVFSLIQSFGCGGHSAKSPVPGKVAHSIK